jgi:hypothetical protein
MTTAKAEGDNIVAQIRTALELMDEQTTEKYFKPELS